jgi:hypothetical protein
MRNVRFVESIGVLAIALSATQLTAQDIGSVDHEQLRQFISKRPCGACLASEIAVLSASTINFR